MSHCTAADLDIWLALTGDPADEGLYFLGPNERRITFYSQQVRALRLVHALKATNRLQGGDDVAVIGAGAAGTTAAVALALAGGSVVLYDPADTIVQLQSGSQRLLHPHVYEWPALGSFDARAGLPILDWSAGKAGEVAADLQVQFAAYQASLGQRLMFEPGRTLETLERTAGGWRVTTAAAGGEKRRVFKTVVLAIGFGEERCRPNAVTLGYWKAGGVDAAAAEPQAGVRYLISGSGDGGLTDLMALLVKDFQHVEFAEDLFGALKDEALSAAVERAYAGAVLDTDLAPAFDRDLLPLLDERNILDKLARRLRTDRKVTLNSTRPILAFGRAARLNQVLAYAILQAALRSGRQVELKGGDLGAITSNGKAVSAMLTAAGKSRAVAMDKVLCRHGPDTADHYGFAKPEFDRYDVRRKATLTAHPQYEAPPSLAPETYEMFEMLDIATKPAPIRTALTAAVKQRDASVWIGRDSATHALIQRGAWTFDHLVDECERLVTPVTIHLAVEPDALDTAMDWIRLARASNGKIILVAEPTAATDWTALDGTIGPATPTDWVRRPTRLPPPDVRQALNDSLLRRLDAEVNACVATGGTPALDTVAPCIAASLVADWAAWRVALDAQPPLKAAFLRWLYSVEPSGDHPWSGRTDDVGAMGSALVLMLATHLGEPLTPAILNRGNLSFGMGALAVGSGCSRVTSGKLETWTDPRQWDVDAVVLSGTSELEIVAASDRLTAAGAPLSGLLTASRVEPAIIQNSKRWRAHLASGLAPWRDAVEDEFKRWRDRQEKAVKRFEP